MGSSRVRSATRVLALVAGLVLVVSVAGGGQVAPAAEAPTDPALTQLRLRIATTSDWAAVDLEELRVRAAHITSTTGVEHVWSRQNGWSVVAAGGDAEVVIDLVAELAPGASPRMAIAKGRVGSATVELLRTDASAYVPVAKADLVTQDPDRNVVVDGLDRGAVLGDGLQVPRVDDRRLTLAFYYPWFDADDVDDRRIAPDDPASWFATSSRAHVEGMVAEAASAGIDGFLVSWEGALHGDVVDLLAASAAATPGFVLAPTLELRTFVRDTLLGSRFDVAAAAEAVRDFFRRVPASSTLTVDGRPVVVAFGMWDLDADEWRSLRQELADLDLFVVGDRLEPGFAVDGHYRYDPNSSSIDELDERNQVALDRTKLESMVDPDARRHLWAATASPGFDNRASTLLLGRQFTARADGWRYDQTWRVALRSSPDWVFVTSWNEWYEQTHVSPGRRTGRVALDQTAAWSRRFAATAG